MAPSSVLIVSTRFLTPVSGMTGALAGDGLQAGFASRVVVEHQRGVEGRVSLQAAQVAAHHAFDHELQARVFSSGFGRRGGQHRCPQQGGLQDAVFVQHHDAGFERRPLRAGVEEEIGGRARAARAARSSAPAARARKGSLKTTCRRWKRSVRGSLSSGKTAPGSGPSQVPSSGPMRTRAP